MLEGASDLRFSSVERRPEAGADALSGDVHQHSGTSSVIFHSICLLLCFSWKWSTISWLH